LPVSRHLKGEQNETSPKRPTTPSKQRGGGGKKKAKVQTKTIEKQNQKTHQLLNALD